MSVASVLLRVVLMISLLFNGLNVALAGGHDAAVAAASGTGATPPCHGHDAMAVEAPGIPLAAPADDGHCKLKDCIRACAQQPALASEGIAPLPAVPATARRWPAHTPGQPAAPLSRIQRPPIA